MFSVSASIPAGSNGVVEVDEAILEWRRANRAEVNFNEESAALRAGGEAAKALLAAYSVQAELGISISGNAATSDNTIVGSTTVSLIAWDPIAPAVPEVVEEPDALEVENLEAEAEPEVEAEVEAEAEPEVEVAAESETAATRRRQPPVGPTA